MSRTTTKHQHILETLRQRILEGEFRPGERLPPDVDLVREFNASRPTVAKAVGELERTGLVRRRRGAGTFVEHIDAENRHLFGLLIPGLGETEIFEPICGEIARAAQQDDNALLWGGGFAQVASEPEDKERHALELCQQYVRNKTSGVFFAPIELTGHQREINTRIIEQLDRARIAVVLLDRDYLPYPERSRFDLVGIDNRRAGNRLGRHLLERGCRSITFIARPGSASTIQARIAGLSEALTGSAEFCGNARSHRVEPDDTDAIREIIRADDPDGIVCGNDATAAKLMHTLEEIGVDVPGRILVAAVDDVRYAHLLRVPLTTVHQPCGAIGRAAYDAMLARLRRPEDPARDILLDCELVVRASTGGKRHVR